MPRVKKTTSQNSSPKGKPKSTNDISIKQEDDTFVVHHIDETLRDENHIREELEISPQTPPSPMDRVQPREQIIPSTVVHEEPPTAEKVKVKFDKFSHLVANHNFADVIQKNFDEDVIISSNLLTDLANAHEKEEERRIPLIFIVGMVLGVVITYILLNF